jgi:hypothetical protein
MYVSRVVHSGKLKNNQDFTLAEDLDKFEVSGTSTAIRATPDDLLDAAFDESTLSAREDCMV